MKPVSQKQKTANNNNALLGGVKTDAGKQISRFNALQHGILRASISNYEKLDFETLFTSLKQDFAPRNTLEEIVIERITISYIKLLRVSKAEVEFIRESISPLDFPNTFGGHKYQAEFSAEGFEKLATVYSRYESSTENRLYKAINKLIELKRFQSGKESI